MMEKAKMHKMKGAYGGKSEMMGKDKMMMKDKKMMMKGKGKKMM